MSKIILANVIFTIVIILASVHIGYSHQPIREGCNYYFDAAQGKDTNSGLSAKKAWKSLDKLREIQLKAGDSILLRRGSVFAGIIEICGQGKSGSRIVIDAYGKGQKPCITAPDGSLYAVCIANSDYVTLQNIEIVNTGKERMAHHTGVKVICNEYGISHNIILNTLYIHDVNGSLDKGDVCSGILIESKWEKTVSIFDSLMIENCVIRRCERDGIRWTVSPWSRKNWHLSTHTIVRKNLIEEVPGDGIVPIGCNDALVEYNLMRNCSALLPDGQYAAGIWPWSCDNTIIQYNEVSDHKAPGDGEGFDADYNCTNTTIRYNYSHDNDGGFVLICNAGPKLCDTVDNIGNTGTVVQYNISINDAIRTRETRIGIFSPTIHITGPCKDTRINNNILYVGIKPEANVDRRMIVSDSWGGFADSTFIKENIFFTPEVSDFEFTKSTNNMFDRNYYLGTFKRLPNDKNGKTQSAVYQKLLEKGTTGFEALASMFEKVEIGDGAAYVTVVNKKAIKKLFEKMKSAKKIIDN